MSTSERGLRCEGLTKSFPGVRALDAVDLEVRPGQVVVLIGENGAGKSTLVKILSGVYEPDEGEMLLDGAPYKPSGPREAIAAGVGMIHQELNLLPGMSVAENIFLGRQPVRGGRIDYSAMREAARKACARVGLQVDVTRPVGRLSVAAQQQVEIAKALSLQAHVLILDEPTAALGAEESEQLFAIVDELREQGVGFVYISHRLHEAARVGDRIVVLRDGQCVADFDDPDTPVDRLVSAMVGRDVDQIYPDPPAPQDAVVLRVRDLDREGQFAGISFDLHRGEVLGIAGLVGAGRTEVARALFGADPADTGTIEVDGEAVDPRTPGAAIRAGIVLVPEDRKRDGLVLGQSLEENIALPSLESLAEGGLLRRRRFRDLAEPLKERLDIRGQLRQSAGTLSGGNQQKAVIAKWLPRSPKVVIFDEPTRGVDVGAKSAIYEVIRNLADDGVGVIVISSELPEVLGLSNRVVVLADGRQTGALNRDEATEEAVMSLAVR